MKHEWRKKEKDLYIPKEDPKLVDVPKFKFLQIKGSGNPNSEEFKERIEALYSLSYAIKMMPKGGVTVDGYFDYTVYPLEGTWDLSEEGRKKKELDKDELIYTLMIRQPDFVDEKIFNSLREKVKEKKKIKLLDEVLFTEIEEGLSVQILHIGSYDEEAKSFKKMKEFIKENNLRLKTLVHREIYLSDARKVSKDKLKTVLRYNVEK
ncbi:MAG: GyrI-like domain-containing protein [Clostridium chrysemydis]|uniref:GyrI-like domain-containing protein n=1 Tax=Clostridium chrysemydis TaxID=2665504 RepID=UPI003F40B01B